MSTGAKMVIQMYDVTALEDGNPACDSAQSFAPAASLREEGGRKLPDCATLEKDFFRLDGSFEPFPNSTAGRYWGLWSRSMSGENRLFATPPVLQIAFTKSHSSVGFTMRFYEREEDYCTHLRVWWMDSGGNIIAAKEFFPLSASEILQHKVEGYYSIKIAFLKTAKPGRYLKLGGIDYGMELLLDGRAISAAEILEEVDPSGSTVSINTLDMTIYSSEEEFSPLNPKGYFSLFQRKQKISACAVTEDGRKEMGIFFLQGWEADSKNNIKLRAVDTVGLMDKASFDGGIYQDTAAEELLRKLGEISRVAIETDASLGRQKLSGHIGRCTVRQAVGQIALAIGGVVDSSRGTAVKIYPMPQRPSMLIGIERKFSGQRVGLRPVVTGIDLTAHRFTAAAERYTAFEETLSPGTYKILFGEPTHTPVATGATVTDAGANHISLSVADAGKVTVTGCKYLHSKQIISDNMVNQAANLADNRVKAENATLISSANAEQLLKRLHDCSARELESEFSIKLGAERVADMVVVKSLRGESIRGIIESIETDLTGGCIAKIRISGERIETLNIDYAGELRAGQRLGVI